MNGISGISELIIVFPGAARWGLPALLSRRVWAPRFGTVVHLDIPIGGNVSDIVLTSPGRPVRGKFHRERIEVHFDPHSRKTVRKIEVPGSLARWRYRRWRVVGGSISEVIPDLSWISMQVLPFRRVSVINPGTSTLP